MPLIPKIMAILTWLTTVEAWSLWTASQSHSTWGKRELYESYVPRCRSDRTDKVRDESERAESSLNIQLLKEKGKKVFAAGMIFMTMGSPLGTLNAAVADDELAKYAAEGNTVAVDGECFIKKCALETSACANDPSCLKGLSCLARCKGEVCVQQDVLVSMEAKD